MLDSDWDAVLDAATNAASAYLASLPARRVFPVVSAAEVRTALEGALTDEGLAPAEVVADLARAVEPFVTSHASGRFFGFVIGGLHPAAYGAELLTATWDQNAALYAVTPGVAVIEEVAARWLLEVLGLPTDAGVGFVTGGQMANFTCLAAARDEVLRDAGWNVRADGLRGAPPLNIVVKSGRHSTVVRALRFLGLGEDTAVEVACDDQDRMRVDELRGTLAGMQGPTIVCVEAGNINTGAFDAFPGVADAIEEHRARGHPTWTHVDGAVGLLAAASRDRRFLTDGIRRMDSWSTDGHKLLNVAYDCGIAICRRQSAFHATTSIRASYLVQSDGDVRDPMDWTPEFSRRARGVGVYATLRSLGRHGVADLVDRTARLARRFAHGLEAGGDAMVVNDVVFNQVLVRWLAPADRDPDEHNDAVTAAIQADGTAFVSGTTWRGHRLMRISVCDWATDDDDVDRSLAAMLAVAAVVAG